MTDTQFNGFSVEKLQGRENYASWKFAMQAFLECEELWGCVQGIAQYTENAKNMAKARIILSVDKRNYSHVRNALTPKEAWENLQEAFEDRGLTRKVGLLRALTSAKLEDFKSVESYVNKIIETAQKLSEIGFEIQDEMIGALLLSGLPDEYKPMIMGLESSGIHITADAVQN